MNTLRPGLPPLPARMTSLAIDERGFPVPYFVAYVDGKPDHRVMDASKLPIAVRFGLCWQCGQPLGKFRTFCIGPMCSITRTISEPPSHIECVRFAATACPFLSRPHAKRREAGMPEDAREAAGEGLKRNPGAVCLWTTRTFKQWSPPGGGVLFELGDPESTEWYAGGRLALRSEVDASIESGLHHLYEMAEAEDKAKPGRGAVAHLDVCIARERRWLDGQTWPIETEGTTS
jgi:hypothetical protein